VVAIMGKVLAPWCVSPCQAAGWMGGAPAAEVGEWVALLAVVGGQQSTLPECVGGAAVRCGRRKAHDGQLWGALQAPHHRLA